MANITVNAPGTRDFMMGNEAFARGALEAGVQFAASYPGTPSSQILESLAGVAKQMKLYAEWSVNEMVAVEAAAAAAFSGVRSISSMKNAGLCVALDFISHLNYSGLGKHPGGMVIAVADDPEAHSSGDESDMRMMAKSENFPLLEPDCHQEAKDMTKWAFELSEKFSCFIMLRSVTRLSLSSGPVVLGELPKVEQKAHFDTTQQVSPYTPYLPDGMHRLILERMEQLATLFEESPFNWYKGPEKPSLLIISSGVSTRYAMEAVDTLGLQDKVGILKIGTINPFPSKLVAKHLAKAKRVLAIEENDPYIEHAIKETAFDAPKVAKSLKLYGRGSGHIKKYGEMKPEFVLKALADLFEIAYVPRDARYEKKVNAAAEKLLIERGVTWCAGCPHRASFWSMAKAIKRDARDGFMTGDIGCYTLDMYPGGDKRFRTVHCMGSGAGLATGFGSLFHIGSDQPVVALAGDSTFFHASVPALISAIHNNSNMTLVILDNSATAMTGFQPHPGTTYNAMGEKAPVLSAVKLCESLGCTVVVADPFNLAETTEKMEQLLKKDGVKVLIMKRRCELERMREERTKPFKVTVDTEKCRGEKCRFCVTKFKCPALPWDKESGKAKITEANCAGCGVCVEICPSKAIQKEARA